MKFYKHLYIGDSLEDSIPKLKEKAQSASAFHSLYLLTLAMNGRDLLDIRSTKTLFREGLADELPMVVGIAGSEKEAIELTQQIVQDCLLYTNGLDVRGFLMR